MKKLVLIAGFAMVYNLSFAANATMEMPFQQAPKKEKKMVWTDENGIKTEMKSGDMIFINENGDTTKPKRTEVKVEKEIENGKEKTRVWINGKEVDEKSAEFKKYSEEVHGESELKVINMEDGKKMIIIKEETEDEVIIDDEGKHEMNVNVEVSEPENGKRVVTIKKKGENGEEEVEEIIIDNMGEGEEIIKTNDGQKVIVKVKKDMDMDLGEINPDDIEKVNVIKTDKENKIVITLKDGKIIEKIMPKEGGKEVIIIKEEEKTKNKLKKKD